MVRKKMVVYACQGTCGAIVSERRYKAGLETCGAESCSLHGKRFKKREVID